MSLISLQAKTFICPLSREQGWGRVPIPTTPCWDQLFSPSCFCPSCSDWASLTCLKFLSRALIVARDSPVLPACSTASTSEQSHSCPPTGKVNPSKKRARKAAAFNLQTGCFKQQIKQADLEPLERAVSPLVALRGTKRCSSRLEMQSEKRSLCPRRSSEPDLGSPK